MHVLYIMGQDSGGLPHYTAELANVVSNSHNVTILKPAETTADELFDEEITVINAFQPTEISQQNIFNFDLNIKKNIKGILSYKNLKLIREIDPDIVHDPTDEFPQVSVFSYLTRANSGRPYVITKHEIKHGSASPLLKIADITMSLVHDFKKDAAIVHSERQRAALQKQDRNIEQVEVFPLAAFSFFKQFDYAKKSEESNHVLFFGSIIPPKGVKYLIKAVPLIVNQIPDFKLTIAGDGNLPKNCRPIIDNYREHFALRTDFVPNEEVGELFSRAQLVALPYREGWQTGQSATLSTAFAFGKPVIASAIGDFPELIDGNDTGKTVEPENEVALAEAIVDVLQTEQRRKEMSKASERLAERLSWENIGQMHIDLYEELYEDSQQHQVTSTVSQ